jgi:hypothetical protein
MEVAYRGFDTLAGSVSLTDRQAVSTSVCVVCGCLPCMYLEGYAKTVPNIVYTKSYTSSTMDTGQTPGADGADKYRQHILL